MGPKITGPNAGGLRRSAIRTSLAARVGQFRHLHHTSHETTKLSKTFHSDGSFCHGGTRQRGHFV